MPTGLPLSTIPAAALCDLPLLSAQYDDRNIRSWNEFEGKLRYIHRNPVKRGLWEHAEDWRSSSFRHYAMQEKGVVEIESEWTAGERERQSQGGRRGRS